MPTPEKVKKRDNDSIIFLTDDSNICDIIIAEKKCLSSNNILESICSMLSSLKIGGAKYRIYSRKIETATNITIHKKYLKARV